MRLLNTKLNGARADIATESIIERLYGKEIWRGKSADQTGNNWASDRLVPFIATSGASTYGSEIKLIGSDDTPIQTDKLLFSIDKILIVGVSDESRYKIRFVWSETDFATGLSKGNYTETMIKFDPSVPTQTAGYPYAFRIPQLDAGTKVWAQCWNGASGETVSFYIGIHEYN